VVHHEGKDFALVELGGCGRGSEQQRGDQTRSEQTNAFQHVAILEFCERPVPLIPVPAFAGINSSGNPVLRQGLGPRLRGDERLFYSTKLSSRSTGSP